MQYASIINIIIKFEALLNSSPFDEEAGEAITR
ncbi:hypothetical protein HDC91_001011 [Mucilaginibacter sp. AK015]|nr:hypothetical protein [Mucilaginibacter sp. AK015]